MLVIIERNSIVRLREGLVLNAHMSKNILQELIREQGGILPPSFMHAVLKSVHEGILFISLDGEILSINRAAKQFLSPLDPKPFSQVSEVFSDDFFGFSMREALHFGIIHEKIYRTISSRELEISCSFLFDGPKQGILLILNDITEKKELLLKAQHSERLKKLGEMVASITHEIRNPLGGIRGYSSLLFRDLYDQKPLQEMAGFIVDGTKALERLVSGVLTFAKPVQLDLRSIEVNQFIRQFVRFIKADPSKPQLVHLEIHTPEDPFIAPVDSEALHLSLLNLIFNAYQAMPSGGTLTLSLLKMDSCYQIAISDTGIGMSSENLDKIFSPFFTTKKTGNGIGLSEVQKIVKAHSGEIDVRSAPSKGTTFTLTLPLQRIQL